MKSNHEYRVRMQFLKRWNEIKQKKFSDRNFDVIFRLMLLIYGENMKKLSKCMQNNLRNSMTKNRYLQRVQRTEYIN